MRRTKIVCTLGPATSSAEGIRHLIEAGMNVARLNFSHGDRATHCRTIRTIRQVSAECGVEIGILQDLCGPKIRLGELPQSPLELHSGDNVVLSPSPRPGDGALPVSYPYLLEDVQDGERILLADGLVELRVEAHLPEGLSCRVLTGDSVSSHKGVNLPGTQLRVPAFTDKDRLDLEAGLGAGVDIVALSFVRHENDLDPVRQMIDASDARPLLIAKIEKPQAVDRLEQILRRVDGVMVARGDLGVEMPVEQVPMIQKQIIRLARRWARPVITATQMLRSMVSSPMPLRAEATDVANAILDGTDAVMLSEETAIGAYPNEAVTMLDRIAREVEPHLASADLLEGRTTPAEEPTAMALGRAACGLARDIGACAIIASTTSGSTARLIARHRPSAPVLGLTPRPWVERQLCLSWGVIPAHVEHFGNTDAMLASALDAARQHGLAQAGDRLVVTAGLPINVEGVTNLLHVIDVDDSHP